jgi:hypothetical protein
MEESWWYLDLWIKASWLCGSLEREESEESRAGVLLSKKQIWFCLGHVRIFSTSLKYLERAKLGLGDSGKINWNSSRSGSSFQEHGDSKHTLSLADGSVMMVLGFKDQDKLAMWFTWAGGKWGELSRRRQSDGQWSKRVRVWEGRARG